MNPLNDILRKSTGEYKLTKLQGKNQPPNVYGRPQTVYKKWKRKWNPNTGGEDIQLPYGMEFGIEKYALLIIEREKWRMVEGLELPNKEKIWTHEEKQTYKYLGISEADTLKQAKMKEKKRKKKNTSGERENNTELDETRYFCNMIYTAAISFDG